MKAITYRNTQSAVPRWTKPAHELQPRGIAYETDTHFVHFYCSDDGWYTLSPGLTVTQKKNGSLVGWVKKNFGAKDIQDVRNAVGEARLGVWRPGLLFKTELDQVLGHDQTAKHSDLVALRLLLSALAGIFEYVEPSENGLLSYGHKTRELLIAACTEAENQWKRYFSEAERDSIGSNYTTKDYVKLCSALFLREYRLTARAHGSIPPIEPFAGWDSQQPTQSLTWYHAYNETKHNRSDHFDKASVQNCLNAVAANIVLFCVRYSPYNLVNESGGAQTLFQQLFEIELSDFDAKSYYVPKLQLGENQNEVLICYDSYAEGQHQPWNLQKLQL